ncbi:hypothetical protein O3P69_000121 [Scylla paramamosain]|uniref:Uncharacterized protein n=1 Tax=Scylla paramamosain TaxID=85552 RepID=A0AAW0UUI4_SCYPA
MERRTLLIVLLVCSVMAATVESLPSPSYSFPLYKPVVPSLWRPKPWLPHPNARVVVTGNRYSSFGKPGNNTGHVTPGSWHSVRPVYEETRPGDCHTSRTLDMERRTLLVLLVCSCVLAGTAEASPFYFLPFMPLRSRSGYQPKPSHPSHKNARRRHREARK